MILTISSRIYGPHLLFLLALLTGNYLTYCPGHTLSLVIPPLGIRARIGKLTRILRFLPFVPPGDDDEVFVHKIIGKSCFECKVKRRDLPHVKSYSKVEEGRCRNKGYEVFVGNRNLYTRRWGRLSVDIFKVDDPSTYRDNIYKPDPQNPIGYMHIDLDES